MKEFLTPAEHANEIRMVRSSYEGAFLVVEGQTDALFYKRLTDSERCRLIVCCGHDLTGLLAVGLFKAIGSHNRGEIKTETLERSLRLAYEFVWFQKTSLYASIREWEERNNPFQVFPLLD